MKQTGVSAEVMAEIDRSAREDYGIPQIVLMENAGRAVAEVILEEIGSIKDKNIAIFCGKGNNGGDGFVAARYLANKFPKKLVIYLTDADNIKKGAAKDNLGIIKKMGLVIEPVENFLLYRETSKIFTIGIDAVFGIGFKGELKDNCALLGQRLNSSDIKLYAVDIPSGLSANTGIGAKDSFKAYKTITFGLPKQGFFINDGPALCNEIIVRDSGFPSVLLQSKI